MRAHIPGRYAALALLLGGLACSHNKANVDEGSVVAQDSTKANNDTSAYKGQERDTTAMPTPAPTDTTQAAPAPTPTDTTQAAPAPTPADTTQYQPQAAPTPTDTSSYVPQQTPSDTGAAAQPTSPAPAPGADTSGMSHDTTKAQ
jgi:hypothetical protein